MTVKLLINRSELYPEQSCGYVEPESAYRDPDTGEYRTARCNGGGRLVVRGTGMDSHTDGEMFISVRPCPRCYREL